MSDRPSTQEILLVGPLLPSGGVTRYVKDLLAWSGRCRFVLFNVARPAKRYVRPGTGYIELFNAGIARALCAILITLGHIFAFPWVLMRSKVRVVHICGVSYWSFWENACYILMSRLLGRHVTLHYLGALDLYYNECSRAERALVETVLRWPQRVILLSEKVRALTATFIPPERLSVIPSNVDTRRFLPLEDKPSVDDGIVRILFVGGGDPVRKGVYDLLDAAVDVVKVNPVVRFVMSGGDSFRDVERRWRELGLDEYVEFIGWIPEHEKAHVYQSADILVLPSHNEGLPYVIIEALASGLPIVASSVGGIPEVIRQRENGYVISPGDSQALASSILALTNDAELRRTMGSDNRQRAEERYSTVAAIGRLEEILASVMM